MSDIRRFLSRREKQPKANHHDKVGSSAPNPGRRLESALRAFCGLTCVLTLQSPSTHAYVRGIFVERSTVASERHQERKVGCVLSTALLPGR
jgi:hypothetical protein